MKITVLIENATTRHNLLCSHGQSLLIEEDNKKILVDVGEIPENLLYNLKSMGIMISEIDAIVISHNHIDHAGALEKLLPKFEDIPIYITNDFGVPHYKDFGPKYIFLDINDKDSVNVSLSKEISKKITGKNIHIAEIGKEISNGIKTTGSILGKPNEQALIYDQHELGINIILGCCHPGIKEIVEQSKNITKNSKVRSILGGFHFNKMKRDEIVNISKYFKTLNLEAIFPNHCTGIEQVIWLKELLGDIVKFSKTYSIGVGNSITIEKNITCELV